MIKWVHYSLLFLILLSPAWAHAAAPIPPVTTPMIVEELPRAPAKGAPVVVDGRTYFYLQGISSYPAELRAKLVAGRIRDAAADLSFTAAKITLVDRDDRTAVVFGNRALVTLFDLDGQAEGVNRKLLAEVVRAQVIAAVNAYRRARQPRVLLENAGYTIVAAFLLAAIVFGLGRSFHWLKNRTLTRVEKKVKELEAQSLSFLQVEQLSTVVVGFLSGLQWLLILIFSVLFLQFALGRFPWTRQAASGLLGLFTRPLATMGQGILEALPNLAFLAVLSLVMWYFLHATRLFFAGVAAGTITITSFKREWANATYRIVRIMVIAFAVVVGYPYIPGSSSEAFKGVSIFLGVVFSLGSTSFISNIIAGYTMIFRGAFQVGDRIRIENFVGYVTETGVSVTRLRTPKNEMIVLPNSMVLSSSLINYSALARQQGLILHTTVGIGYETSWRQVEAMLLKAAAQTPGLLKDPPPFVLQTALGDFSVTYELNVYCDAPERVNQLYSELHRNVLDVFNEYGVQIMTPAYESDPATPKVVPKEAWYTAPAEPAK